MHILGATKIQIILMFLRERFYAICLAGATGIITDNLIPLYWGECGSDRVTLQDGEVILYIPDLYRSGGSIHPLEYERGVVDKNLIVREGSIEAGQTLRIKNAGNQTELSVAGVIRSFSSDLALKLNYITNLPWL